MKAIRALFYLGMVAVLAAAVYYKIGVIQDKRGAPTVSILKEWEKEGKPVEVSELQRGEIVLLERTTAEAESPTLARAQVSRSLQPKIRPGDEAFFMVDDEMLAGKIASVSRVANRLTGLYDVRISPHRPFPKDKVGQSVVIDVAVAKIPNVLKIPQKAIIPTAAGEGKVWKLEGDVVSQVPVRVGRASADFVEVLSGLSAGDEVVVRGGSILEVGERVRVVSSSLTMNRGGE